MIFRKLLIAAAISLTGGSAGAQSLEGDRIWNDMSVAEARALATESGGVVRSVEDTETGEYTMTIDYPDGIPVYLDGRVCKGAGDAKRCEEFHLGAYFAFDSEAEAAIQERNLDIVWLADKQFGKEVMVWRMGFIAGVTRSHMLRTFQAFVETVWAAHAIVYPATPDEEGSSAV